MDLLIPKVWIVKHCYEMPLLERCMWLWIHSWKNFWLLAANLSFWDFDMRNISSFPKMTSTFCSVSAKKPILGAALKIICSATMITNSNLKSYQNQRKGYWGLWLNLFLGGLLKSLGKWFIVSKGFLKVENVREGLEATLMENIKGIQLSVYW